MQLKQTSQTLPQTSANQPLPELLEEYKAISLKLYQFSDISEVSAAETERLTSLETSLLDRQAELIERALRSPITSMGDAKSLLALWHLEVVESAAPESLSAADELVETAYKYITGSQ